MSDPVLGHYHFLPWVRQGLALAVTTVDDPAAPADVGPELDAALSIVALKDGSPQPAQTAGVKVRLHGHGDVIGFDQAQVIKTEPGHGTPNFESNYFAGIEFDQPGFPWLFTPAAPKGERLRPWIALIVLTEKEFSIPKDAPNPLPRIEVTALGALPDLSQSWAWAHAQVTGDLPANGLANILKNDPGRATSRLLSPRKLDPDTHYFAFLVPAFEAGRLAGIGADTGTAPKTVPAWPVAGGATSLILPVYYRFEFTTSDRGDFESLVRQLQPRVLSPELGFRLMDVSDPAPPNFPSAGDPLLLAGALRPPPPAGWVEPPWNDPGKSNFQNALAPLINLTSPTTDDPDNPNIGGPNNGDPKVVPPIYGRWHAGVTAVQLGLPGWVNELNLDPRTRSMAGLGTRVVDRERVPLMASAWQQVAGIERANQVLRQAQLARAAMVASFAKNFQTAAAAALLTLTQAVQSKLAASPLTVRGTIAQGQLPVRALSGAFRRVVRPLGPIRRRQGATTITPGQFVSRINTGDVRVMPPPHPPSGMVSLDDVSDQLYPAWIPAWLRPFLRYAFWFLLALAVVAAVVIIVVGALLGLLPIAIAIALAVAGALIALAYRLRDSWLVPDEVRFNNLTPATIAAVPPRPVFRIMPAGQPIPPGGGGGATDSPDATAFRTAAGRLAGKLQAPPRDPPPPPPADITTLQVTILTRLDPMVTVPARIGAIVQINPTLGWNPTDPIAPVMASPEFPQAMYLPLRDMSQDFLLPGLKFVPPDTLTLLETNEAFVEAYMTGLNHEMSRQLLWNEYPTDQRGSYFRQFWDVRSYVRTPDDPADPDALKESLRDIKPIHQWPKDLPLGSNSNRPEIKAGNLVLLVRGELLRRYPNAIIYACKAQWNGEGYARVLSATEQYPLFRGTLDPDVTFFGFNLTEDQARGGNRDQGGDPGWFIVLQQPVSEPRFGLEPVAKDPVATWADLAWSDFAFTSSGPGAPIFAQTSVNPQNVSLVIGPDNADEGNNAWGTDSAQTAYITFRRPARIAVHADLMLPKRPAA